MLADKWAWLAKDSQPRAVHGARGEKIHGGKSVSESPWKNGTPQWINV